jgi:hypothetical protein
MQGRMACARAGRKAIQTEKTPQAGKDIPTGIETTQAEKKGKSSHEKSELAGTNQPAGNISI